MVGLVPRTPRPLLSRGHDVTSPGAEGSPRERRVVTTALHLLSGCGCSTGCASSGTALGVEWR